MSTIVEDKVTAAVERPGPTVLDLPVYADVWTVPAAAPTARGPRRGRLAIGAAALAVGVLATAALLYRPPAAPAPPLPAMSASMGFWDRIQAPALPAMPASMGFWDFVQPPASALPAMPNDMGFWDRIR
jgi:hypothetical protein